MRSGRGERGEWCLRGWEGWLGWSIWIYMELGHIEGIRDRIRRNGEEMCRIYSLLFR